MTDSKTRTEAQFDDIIGQKPLIKHNFDPSVLGVKDRRITELLRNAGIKNKACLDIGPGTGRWLSFLKENGAARLVGIDISSEVLTRCAPLCESTQKLDLETSKIQSDDNAFDIIISIEVLEHLRTAELYFSEIIRVAKPGACVVISLPNIASMMSRFRLLFGYLPTAIASDPTHIKFYRQKDITKLLGQWNQKPVFAPTSFTLHPFNTKSKFRIATNKRLSVFDDSLLFTFNVIK